MCACTPALSNKNDAVPRFFPSTATEHAPVHAAYEWRTPGEGGVFTAARAKLVPQIDKLGKAEIWKTIQNAPKTLRNGIVFERDL